MGAGRPDAPAARGSPNQGLLVLTLSSDANPAARRPPCSPAGAAASAQPYRVPCASEGCVPRDRCPLLGFHVFLGCRAASAT